MTNPPRALTGSKNGSLTLFWIYLFVEVKYESSKVDLLFGSTQVSWYWLVAPVGGLVAMFSIEPKKKLQPVILV